MTQPRVLHLSADFPDPLVPAKTPVIARLIDLSASEFDHRVISINRKSPSAGSAAKSALQRQPVIIPGSLTPFDYGDCLQYMAPPRGLLHRTMLNKLAEELVELIRDQPIPDVIIGHKLSVEGIVASRIAQKLKVPYAITIQGNTDTKILRYRPDLAGLFRDILEGAAHVFCFAPWARDRIAKQLSIDASAFDILPCPTERDEILTPKPHGDDVISVFHLRNYRGKNLPLLIDAMKALGERGSPVPLTVIGGGDGKDVAECKALASGIKNVSFAGALRQPELSTRMNQSIALALPSKRESFGLVFLEALFAGLPIIYPSGTSVGGYFDDLPFAISVDATKPRHVADAIAFAVEKEAALKSALAEWQQKGGLDRFKRAAIADQFSSGLRHAIKAHAA